MAAGPQEHRVDLKFATQQRSEELDTRMEITGDVGTIKPAEGRLEKKLARERQGTAAPARD